MRQLVETLTGKALFSRGLTGRARKEFEQRRVLCLLQPIPHSRSWIDSFKG